MQKYQKTINFEKVWQAFYQIIKQIGVDMKNHPIDTYAYTLYDRALYLFDAYVAIEKTTNLSVCFILGRCLFEIKIKASQYQDDKNEAIANVEAEIKQEIERFLQKVRDGESFSAQALQHILKNRDFEIKTKSGREKVNRKTIKSRASEADLDFDYEIIYWLESLFVHSHPLSLMIEHKEAYNENVILNILAQVARDIDLLNTQVLSTMLWITRYLYENILSDFTQSQINELEKMSQDLFAQKFGAKWEVDEDVKLGTMKIINEQGEEIEFSRKQRK